MTAAAPRAAGRVTVAIPTWNRAGYLRECVASVQRQHHADLEILIGDNASTDETADVVRSLMAEDARIRYVRHAENLGMVGNWNALLAGATGDFFLLLSDDDLLAPDMVARLAAACAEPGVAFAYCPYFVIDARGRVVDESGDAGPPVEPGEEFLAAHLGSRRDLCPSAFVHRLAAPGERPIYDPEIGLVCDLYQRLVLATTGAVACVDERLVYYRVHEQNETRKAEQFSESLVRVAQAVARRSGALAPYAPLVRRYVAATVSTLATSSTLRGRTADASVMADVLERHGFATAALRIRLTLCRLPILRWVAASRRWWRARRASRRAQAQAGGWGCRRSQALQ